MAVIMAVYNVNNDALDLKKHVEPDNDEGWVDFGSIYVDLVDPVYLFYSYESKWSELDADDLRVILAAIDALNEHGEELFQFFFDFREL